MQFTSWLELLSFLPAIETALIAGLLILWVKDFLFPKHPFFRKPLFRQLPSLKRGAKIVLLLFLLFLLLKSGSYSVGQYLVWKSGVPGMYFLPPEQPITYFLGYVWQRFGKEVATTIFLGGVVFLIIKIANLLTNNRLFYDEEPYLAALAILAAGWPASFLVISGTLILGAVVHLYFFFLWLWKKRPMGRLSLMYFWLPLALLVQNFGAIIEKWVGLEQLKI